MHCGQQMLSHWRFSQRQKLRLIEKRLRALRLWVKLADGLDLVAKELDAHRPVRFRRVDIEDAAATREMAGHLHQVHARVTNAGQVRGEHFNVDFFPAAKRYGKTRIVVAIEEAQRCRLDGRNQDGNRAGDKLPQSGRTLLLHVGVRREVFKRENVVRGQAHNLSGIECSGKVASSPQHGLKGFGGLVVRDHHHHRLAGSTSQQWNVDCAGGRSKSGDTPTPRTKAEMPSYALKRGGVLQFRKNIADERENHAPSVYQCGQCAMGRTRNTESHFANCEAGARFWPRPDASTAPARSKAAMEPSPAA